MLPPPITEGPPLTSSIEETASSLMMEETLSLIMELIEYMPLSLHASSNLGTTKGLLISGTSEVVASSMTTLGEGMQLLEVQLLEGMQLPELPEGMRLLELTEGMQLLEVQLPEGMQLLEVQLLEGMELLKQGMELDAPGMEPGDGKRMDAAAAAAFSGDRLIPMFGLRELLRFLLQKRKKKNRGEDALVGVEIRTVNIKYRKVWEQ